MMLLRRLVLLAAVGVVAQQPPGWRDIARLMVYGTPLVAVLRRNVVQRYASPPGIETPRNPTPEELEAMNFAMRNLSAAQTQGYDAFVANYNFTKKTVELALRGQLPTEQEDCSNPDVVPLQAPTTAPDVVPMQAPTTAPTRTPTGAPARRRHTRRPLVPASPPLESHQ